MIKRVFPETAVLMIEPRQDNNRYLKRICTDYPDCQYFQDLYWVEPCRIVNERNIMRKDSG